MLDFFYVLLRLDFSSAIDILIVAVLFYWALTLIQGTRAVQLLRGILILSILAAITASTFSRLVAFSWLVNKTLPALLVAIPVIFQPELRRALERVGRRTSKLFVSSHPDTDVEKTVKAIGRAVEAMSNLQHGALIVLERNTGLVDYIETGIQLDAIVTPDLLRTIFFPNTTLHDGGIIIHGDRIAAAGVVLPLGENITSDKHLLGTRHRAALGITETTDAIAITVSEETGTISISRDGMMERELDRNQLELMLLASYETQLGVAIPLWRRIGYTIMKYLGMVKPTKKSTSQPPSKQ